jgi:hypothetical protein
MIMHTTFVAGLKLIGVSFAAMHADLEVMNDFGGPISRRESDAKLDRYVVAYRKHGFSRLAIEDHAGAFPWVCRGHGSRPKTSAKVRIPK